GSEARVEDDRNRAQPHGAEEDFQELDPVADQHPDALARARAERGEHRSDAVHALVERTIGDLPLAPPEQIDDRDLVGRRADRCVEEEAEIARAVRLRWWLARGIQGLRLHWNL